MQTASLLLSGWIVADLGVWFAFQYSHSIGLRYFGALSVTAIGFTAMILAMLELAQ